MRQLGDTIDLSTFDYQTGRHQMLHPNVLSTQMAMHGSGSTSNTLSAAHYQRNAIRRPFIDPIGRVSSPSPSIASSSSSPTPSVSSASTKQNPFDFR